MGPIVEASGPIPKAWLLEAKWIVLGNFHAGLFHQLQTSVIEFARALPVQNKVDRHMGAGALGQCFGELAADFALLIDIRLKTDGVLGATNRFEHSREDFVAVAQCDNLVAGNQSGPEQIVHRSPKLRVLG